MKKYDFTLISKLKKDKIKVILIWLWVVLTLSLVVGRIDDYHRIDTLRYENQSLETQLKTVEKTKNGYEKLYKNTNNDLIKLQDEHAQCSK